MTALTLARNEWIKTTRRPALWVTLLCLLAIVGIVFFQRYSSGLSNDDVTPLRLPDGWAFILGEPGPMPAIFGAIVVILLVASEFSWRTARQNVIDGLSREQFYAGKVLLVPGMSLALLGLVVALGVAFALPGTGLSDLTGPLVGLDDLAFAGAVLLSMVGMGAMALFIASVVRSSGPAMALFFFYIAFGEQLLAALAARFIPAVAAVAHYAPGQVFMNMAEARIYYPSLQEAAVARALERGAAAPVFPSATVLVGVALGWTAFFLLAGFLAFRRRDL